ncbi:GNAT family N-acetyltransferase [Winogradskya humida]|uniref:Glycosyl transferase family 1 n=1 Tax=Winogradskya humida TaxID=113566 RepID=A0ABQ4A5W2_9ACTN|nr:GNAT family N-acetyltransferase [Actinoplanes humidus]GIE26223.1 glycosyl transferase family 1 [Actinoplanes humidus]
MTLEEFEKLGPQWETLYAKSASATPFLAHGWLSAYWRAFNPADVRIVCVHDGAGRLVAAAALRVQRRRGVRTLIPLAAELTDFSDVLLDDDVPDAGEELAASLLALPGWDVIELPEAPPGAQVWRLLNGWPGQAFARPASVCLELPVGATEVVLAGLPAKQRRHLRRNDRLDLRHEAVPADPESLATGVGELLDLHAREWDGRGGNALHGTETFRRHLTTAVQNLAPQGRARLTRHTLDGVLAAVSLTLYTAGTVAGYLYGADPSLRKQVDISALLIDSGLRLGREHGTAKLSLLRGEESGKLRWQPLARRNQRMTLLRPHFGLGHGFAVAGLISQAGRASLRRIPAVTRFATRLGF